jgi:hypothetical protein
MTHVGSKATIDSQEGFFGPIFAAWGLLFLRAGREPADPAKVDLLDPVQAGSQNLSQTVEDVQLDAVEESAADRLAGDCSRGFALPGFQKATGWSSPARSRFVRSGA